MFCQIRNLALYFTFQTTHIISGYQSWDTDKKSEYKWDKYNCNKPGYINTKRNRKGNHETCYSKSKHIISGHSIYLHFYYQLVIFLLKPAEGIQVSKR